MLFLRPISFFQRSQFSGPMFNACIFMPDGYNLVPIFNIHIVMQKSLDSINEVLDTVAHVTLPF